MSQGSVSFQTIVAVVHSPSRVQFFVTLWTIAHQPPLSMGFSRQEYWGGLPFPFTGALLEPKIEPETSESLSLAGRFFTTQQPGNP